jgi:hypothetical protein
MRREVELALLGTGAVSAMGWGAAALLGRAPQEGRMATLSRPATEHAVYRVPMDAPEAQSLQREPRLRRASGISHFLTGACREALAEAEKNTGPLVRGRMGLIGVFHTGAVHYSRRFFQGAREQGRKFASPALFPETVHNSPLSHAAAILGISGRAYSLVGDASIWAGALATAALWLELDAVEGVIVAAAEEIDPIALEAYEAAGWLGKIPGFVPSEGAAAVVVAKAKGVPSIVRIEEGTGFRNPREAGEAARTILSGWESGLPVAKTAEGTWQAGLESEILEGRKTVHLPGKSAGEAFVASAGWDLIRAASLKQRLVLPFWGSNFQIAALQFGAGT